eukprot:4296159-Lingulodinium_polyedra.AAC.1
MGPMTLVLCAQPAARPKPGDVVTIDLQLERLTSHVKFGRTTGWVKFWARVLYPRFRVRLTVISSDPSGGMKSSSIACRCVGCCVGRRPLSRCTHTMQCTLAISVPPGRWRA